jgi:antitoxin YefM
MSKQVSYSYARQNLASLLNDTIDAQEAVVISRRGHDDVAMIPAAELKSLEETAHLLRSPKNAQRLLSALQRALERPAPGQSIDDLKRDVGLT